MTARLPDQPPHPLDPLVAELLGNGCGPEDLAAEFTGTPTFANGRYQVGESLGAGAMGRVFRALDSATGTPVALKIMHREHLADPALKERFNAEAALLAKCAHPGTVRLLDQGVDEVDGVPFFTMELMESTLKPWLGRPLRLERVVAWLHAACQAVGHAHSLGVVHRDLKPSNLLLDNGGTTLKIADFSLATDLSAAAEMPDPAEDLRALGEVFYLLLTGQPPRMHCPPPSQAAGRPKLCDAICERATSADPARRFASTAEMAGALARLEASLASRSHTWRRLALAAVLLLGLSGGLLAILVRPTPPPPAVPVGGDPSAPAGGSPGLRTLAEMPTAPTPAAATRAQPFRAGDGLVWLPVPGRPGVLLSATEIRRRDFAAFTATLSPERKRQILSWVTQPEKPELKLSSLTWVDTCPLPDDGAAGIPWTAANVYCEWLTARERAAGRLPEGAFFRLPWAIEWYSALMGEAAVQIGSPWPKTPRFSWGSAWPPPDDSGNFPGVETGGDPRRPPHWLIFNRRDPFPRIAPVASFRPNAHGFHDLDGNLSEWALDRPSATEHPRPARLVVGSSWMFAGSAETPLEPAYDYENVGVEARGFRPALQFAPPQGSLLQITLFAVSDTSGTPHTDHPGAAQTAFAPGQTVRVTWRAENLGSQAFAFNVRHNASAGGAGWKTVYRGPTTPDRPALGGGVRLPGALAVGDSACFSFDMDTTGWPPGPIRISASLHADTPDATCLETSSPGTGLPWIPPDWWLDAFTLTEP